MGRRKHKEINVEHISTNILIQNSIRCNSCPFRIFANEEDKVKLGVGNIYSKVFMILPPYNLINGIDYITILNLLQKAYKELTGNELLENCYVTRYVKCYKYSNYDLYEQANECCRSFLQYEYIKLKPTKIICFGKSWYTRSNINACYVMNPGVLYYEDEEIKQKFMKELSDALE